MSDHMDAHGQFTAADAEVELEAARASEERLCSYEQFESIQHTMRRADGHREMMEEMHVQFQMQRESGIARLRAPACDRAGRPWRTSAEVRLSYRQDGGDQQPAGADIRRPLVSPDGRQLETVAYRGTLKPSARLDRTNWHHAPPDGKPWWRG